MHAIRALHSQKQISNKAIVFPSRIRTGSQIIISVFVQLNYVRFLREQGCVVPFHFYFHVWVASSFPCMPNPNLPPQPYPPHTLTPTQKEGGCMPARVTPSLSFPSSFSRCFSTHVYQIPFRSIQVSLGHTLLGRGHQWCHCYRCHTAAKEDTWFASQ